jgi:hypothetical protein
VSGRGKVVISPRLGPGEGKSLSMRLPVVDTNGRAVMPCTPAKARHLFKAGKAKPKWNAAFSPVQCGKQHLSHLLRGMGLHVHTREGWRPRGGKRKPYGGTRSLGLKRGTPVTHPTYGVCGVGGFDLKYKTVSLNAYRTNSRVTKSAKVQDCQIKTWVAFRPWLVEKKTEGTKKGERAIPLAP